MVRPTSAGRPDWHNGSLLDYGDNKKGAQDAEHFF